MCAASSEWRHLVNAYGVKSGWSCGWQVKLCDPVNTCHYVALRGCLGRKNALYKYLILYFYFLLIGMYLWIINVLDMNTRATCLCGRVVNALGRHVQ